MSIDWNMALLAINLWCFHAFLRDAVEAWGQRARWTFVVNLIGLLIISTWFGLRVRVV